MAGSVGSEDGDMGFQIAPMVDVVFVLLLFFMASAGSQIVEKELTINLPSGQSKGGPITNVTPMVIEISRDGQVTMNNDAFGSPTDRNLLQLKEKLKGILEYGSNDPVIIRPNGDTRHERIVDVLNACSYAGVHNLSFS
jgi:biopolymer transport protein ExbD